MNSFDYLMSCVGYAVTGLMALSLILTAVSACIWVSGKILSECKMMYRIFVCVAYFDRIQAAIKAIPEDSNSGEVKSKFKLAEHTEAQQTKTHEEKL